MIIHRNNPFEKDAEELVSKHHKSKECINKLIAEYARKKGLTEQQIKRLLETVNIKNFHENMKQGINEFPLADYKVIKTYLRDEDTPAEKEVKKKASELPDEYFTLDKSADELISKLKDRFWGWY